MCSPLIRIENQANSNHRNRRTLWPVLVLTAMLAGSGAAADSFTFYVRTNLASDIPGLAAFTDTNLVGAWGITRSASSPWWVNSTLGGVSMALNGAGEAYPTNSPIVVKIPPVPSEASGIVFNGGGGFDVASNASASFIFVTLNGSISGWSGAQANRAQAVLEVNNPTASYTGVTIAPLDGTNALYVANFGEDRVDVFDQTYSPVMLSSNAFADDEVPTNLSVFNVQLIGSNLLFVTYAPIDVFAAGGAVPGAGYVSVFSTGGILLGHLRHGPWMNAPWGVTLVPGHEDTLLVGMFGNGQIAEFDADYGQFRGLLPGPHGRPIEIGMGLWGLSFGNGGNAGPTNQLYFAADYVTTNGFNGIFGALTPVTVQHHFGRHDDDHGHGNDEGDNRGRWDQ